MSEFNLQLHFNSSEEEHPHIEARYPTIHSASKIAFIDEWPGSDDFESGLAFSNRSGSIITSVCSQVGINALSCLLTFAYDFAVKLPKLPDWFSLKANKSFDRLRTNLNKFQPNLVVLVGDNVLKGLGMGDKTASTWRGSVFICDDPNSPVFNLKCLIVQHPLIIMKQYAFMPLFLMDLSRAAKEGQTKELTVPRQDYQIKLSTSECVDRLAQLQADRKPVAMDIEGYVNNITCISFTNKANEAFIIDLIAQDPTDEIILIKAIDRFCKDPLVPKILQNSLCDSFVLAYTFGILIRNIAHDTMLSGWEIYPELPKGLGTQTSIWTNYPYYKADRKKADKSIHHRYCCTDSDVTLQISNAHMENLSGSALTHYKFNMRMLNPLLYAQVKGMKYDGAMAKELLSQTQSRLDEVQSRVDSSTYDGRSVNLNSPKQLASFLYNEKALPKQFAVEKGRKTSRVTTDVKALLALVRKFQLPVLSDILLFRKLEKQRQSLSMTFDSDGRVRCSYNVVGTVTGRLSCSKSAHGTGTNLTTVPKNFRKLYLADDGHYFFQCDLAGADGWTVAAHAAALGDRTMLEDYYFGLKPAKIIALMYTVGREVNTWSRDKLLEESKGVDEEGADGWLYFSTKQVQHGSNYGLKAAAMSQNIMLQSYKRNNKMILVTPSTCQQLQDLYLLNRYPGVGQWQNRLKFTFSNNRGYPELPSASGHTRRFFGRKNDNSTHQEAYSQEPQINTTYATNLAIVRMWEDPENRIRAVDIEDNLIRYTTLDDRVHVVRDCAPKPVGGLLIEPLHQVHDAACGQFPICLEEWACKKIRSYFANPLTIVGTTLTIPFDGSYGRSWGEIPKPL